jgi:hypothetical protein
VIPIKTFQAICACLLLIAAISVHAVGTEDTNNCRNSSGNYCERAGSCAIQGSDWYQYVTIDRSGIFDTQGWPGLCDMVHVSLVQGACSPPAAQVDVIAYLDNTTFAEIPGITGVLVCNAPIENHGDLAPWNAPDGQINGADVFIATQLVLGLRTAGAMQLTRGDMNLDGVIDLADLLLLQQAALP